MAMSDVTAAHTARTSRRQRCTGLVSTFCFAVVSLQFCSVAFSLLGPSKYGEMPTNNSFMNRRGLLSAVMLSSPLAADVASVEAKEWREKDGDWLSLKAMDPDVRKLPSGLMYKVLEYGPQLSETPLASQIVDLKYSGQLTNGKVFTSGSGSFIPKHVMPGWQEAIQQMREGDRWEIYVPSHLGYGDHQAGPVPKGASMVFQMELKKVPEW